VDKTQKAEVVEDLQGLIANAGSVVVAHYTGMTVAEMGVLRARMRAEGAYFKVAKNRLAVRALKGTAAEQVSHLFKGPTGIAYSKDPIAASRVAVAYAKENEKLVILGGVVGTTALDPNGVKALAELPSLDALRGKIGATRCARHEDCRSRSGSRRPVGPRHRRIRPEGRCISDTSNIQTRNL